MLNLQFPVLLKQLSLIISTIMIILEKVNQLTECKNDKILIEKETPISCDFYLFYCLVERAFFSFPPSCWINKNEMADFFFAGTYFEFVILVENESVGKCKFILFQASTTKISDIFVVFNNQFQELLRCALIMEKR